MTRLHVACAADARYVRHSAAMMHSVLASSSELEIVFEFLHPPDLSPRTRTRLTSMVERLGGRIRFHAIAPEAVAELPAMAGVTRTMWYRIWLPELLPEVDRVLYLDVDTIVLRSLAPLALIDLTGHHLAAVANVWEPWNSGRAELLGIPRSRAYFNSGVLLMNLELLRQTDGATAVIDYVKAHRGDLVWPDQDALNVVLGPTHLPLAPLWNCMNSVMLFDQAEALFGLEQIEEARRSPAIRHFEGPSINKPWHVLADRESRALYARHRRGTPWPVYVPSGITPNTLARRGLRAARRRVSS